MEKIEEPISFYSVTWQTEKIKEYYKKYGLKKLILKFLLHDMLTYSYCIRFLVETGIVQPQEVGWNDKEYEGFMEHFIELNGKDS